MIEILSAGVIGQQIDAIIHSLQHPFFMMIGGLIGWFAFIWSLKRDKLKQENKSFWDDQKDEIAVAFIWGLIFLVWDDEAIALYFEIVGKEGTPELQPFYYLAVGPAIDRIYWLYKKATKQE